MLAFIFGGVLLAVIDWKVQRLPTRLVYLTLAGVGAGLVFASLVEWDWVPLATAVAGGLLFANAFFLIWFLTTKFTGMLMLGFGDVRLAAVLGLLLGWYGLEYVLYGAIAGHLLALLIAVGDEHPPAEAAGALLVRTAPDRRHPGGRALPRVRPSSARHLAADFVKCDELEWRQSAQSAAVFLKKVEAMPNEALVV